MIEPPSQDPEPLPRLDRAEPSALATATAARPARIALAHDWLCGYRGGEAVLDRIARLVGDRYQPAGLYVMTDDGKPVTPAIDSLTKITSPLQRIPGAATRLRRWMLPLYPWAVDSLSRRLALDHTVKPIDLLISTSSAAIKGLKAPPGVPHWCYCHTPARYIWQSSQVLEYSHGRGGIIRGLGLRLFRERFKRWDLKTAANVSHFMANSTHTAAEIHRCFDRPSETLHPPVRTSYFAPDPSIRREDFWLFAGALEPYKRADLAIAAANKAGHRLIVVGSGSQSHRLRASAGPTVTFEGRVSDDRLRELYRSASLLLFPQIEDFGIVAAEAQSCGLPVVAFGQGGAPVIDGKTGVVFWSSDATRMRPSVDDLLAAANRLRELGGAATMAAHCRENALRFSEEAFDQWMTEGIEHFLSWLSDNAR